MPFNGRGKPCKLNRRQTEWSPAFLTATTPLKAFHSKPVGSLDFGDKRCGAFKQFKYPGALALSSKVRAGLRAITAWVGPPRLQRSYCLASNLMLGVCGSTQERNPHASNQAKIRLLKNRTAFF